MLPSNNKIVTHLWFNNEAKEAADFYTSLFPGSSPVSINEIGETPSGSVSLITFSLFGTDFMAISAGPMFKFSEALSLYVYCGSRSLVDSLYQKLSQNGNIIMPLGSYEWSSHYAWIKDKFGLSWQLDIDDINSSQKILPSLLFVNQNSTRIKAALEFYKTVFPGFQSLLEVTQPPSMGIPSNSLLFAQFRLSGLLFNAMSSIIARPFDFNESVSFMLLCKTQNEIDYYTKLLTAGGIQQPCGWVKDKFGISWQIIPEQMKHWFVTPDKNQLTRITSAMLKMHKLDISELEKAFNGINLS